MAHKSLSSPPSLPFDPVEAKDVTSKLNERLLSLFESRGLVVETGPDVLDPCDYLVHQHDNGDGMFNMYTFNIFLSQVSRFFRNHTKVNYYNIEGPFPLSSEYCSCRSSGPHRAWKITIQFREE
jgi:hypothetical protein